MLINRNRKLVNNYENDAYFSTNECFLALREREKFQWTLYKRLNCGPKQTIFCIYLLNFKSGLTFFYFKSNARAIKFQISE